MGKKGVIIQGSSKSVGNTNKIVQYLMEQTGFDFIDLKSKQIGAFDYEFQNREDDFKPLMESIVEQYDTIIFATPIYWYTMSGIMKTFFDRISDCLIIEKEIGRQLRGKSMGMISCGSDATIKNGFNMPFVESAHYLGMEYIGDVHTWIEADIIPSVVAMKLTNFAEKLK